MNCRWSHIVSILLCKMFLYLFNLSHVFCIKLFSSSKIILTYDEDVFIQTPGSGGWFAIFRLINSNLFFVNWISSYFLRNFYQILTNYVYYYCISIGVGLIFHFSIVNWISLYFLNLLLNTNKLCLLLLYFD